MALTHPVPAEFLKEIGEVTVGFALLENMIQGLGGALMQSDQAHVAFVEMSFRALRGVVFSLAKARLGDGEPLDELSALLRRAGALEEARNEVTHSIWAAGDKSPPTITRVKRTAKQKQGFKARFEPWTIDRFSQLTTDLLGLADEIQRFHIRLQGITAKV